MSVPEALTNGVIGITMIISLHFGAPASRVRTTRGEAHQSEQTRPGGSTIRAYATVIIKA
jgi:hypothetical protein